jgi:hypothetical protein
MEKRKVSVKLLGGEISGNTAKGDGGGVWVDEKNLSGLFVSSGVVFSNNQASAAYNRKSNHDIVYVKQVGEKITWTTPFTQGYNNYDISYTSGTQVTDLDGDDQFDVLFVVTTVVLVIGVATGVLFYFKKRKKAF